jgi:hypothetical protein
VQPTWRQLLAVLALLLLLASQPPRYFAWVHAPATTYPTCCWSSLPAHETYRGPFSRLSGHRLAGGAAALLGATVAGEAGARKRNKDTTTFFVT